MDEHDRNGWSSITVNIAHYQPRMDAGHGGEANRAKG
jgi:hypothetical protein